MLPELPPFFDSRQQYRWYDEAALQRHIVATADHYGWNVTTERGKRAWGRIDIECRLGDIYLIVECKQRISGRKQTAADLDQLRRYCRANADQHPIGFLVGGWVNPARRARTERRPGPADRFDRLMYLMPADEFLPLLNPENWTESKPVHGHPNGGLI